MYPNTVVLVGSSQIHLQTYYYFMMTLKFFWRFVKLISIISSITLTFLFLNNYEFFLCFL